MSRQWRFGLLSGAALVLVVATGVAARGGSSLALVAAFPVIALLTSISKRLWEQRQHDLDEIIAADIVELVRQFATAAKEAYRPDMARECATMVDDMYRGIAGPRGAHDPDVAAKLTANVLGLWRGVAVSHAAANLVVIRAAHTLAADLVRKHAAEHPVAFYLAPVRELLSHLASRPLTAVFLLGSIGFGGLFGFGLAELYYAGNLMLKILAGMVAIAALWVLFAAMRLFGLLDLRGWLALLAYAGAAVMISLRVATMLHWPGWGGPLVGILFVVAGLVAQPPSMFGVSAANPAGPPTLNPPGMFPPMPPR